MKMTELAAEEYYNSLSKAEIAYMGIVLEKLKGCYERYAIAEKLYATLTQGVNEEVSDDEARVVRVQQIYVSVQEDALDVQKKLADGDYIVDDKMLLEVILGKAGKVSKAQRLAVNDIIVSHSEYLGIADICLENSMSEAVKYRADAVILATPAGSTAYALSSGGPIISHNLDSITATPVSPHSFFNRSIVYSANEEIKVSNIGSYSIKVSIDGRFFDSLEKGDFCIVKKSDKRFKMLTFSANNMFTTLFNKLKILSNIE
jgi:NAD+ kinase